MAKKSKPSTSRHLPVPVEMIERRICLIRRQKVMLDSDLAELYGVQTFNLNKAVKRNRERFPEDFMFQLTKLEADALTFQFGMSKPGGVTGKAREGLPMSIDADVVWQRSDSQPVCAVGELHLPYSGGMNCAEPREYSAGSTEQL